MRCDVSSVCVCQGLPNFSCKLTETEQRTNNCTHVCLFITRWFSFCWSNVFFTCDFPSLFVLLSLLSLLLLLLLIHTESQIWKGTRKRLILIFQIAARKQCRLWILNGPDYLKRCTMHWNDIFCVNDNERKTKPMPMKQINSEDERKRLVWSLILSKTGISSSGSSIVVVQSSVGSQCQRYSGIRTRSNRSRTAESRAVQLAQTSIDRRRSTETFTTDSDERTIVDQSLFTQ